MCFGFRGVEPFGAKSKTKEVIFLSVPPPPGSRLTGAGRFSLGASGVYCFGLGGQGLQKQTQ